MVRCGAPRSHRHDRRRRSRILRWKVTAAEGGRGEGRAVKVPGPGGHGVATPVNFFLSVIHRRAGRDVLIRVSVSGSNGRNVVAVVLCDGGTSLPSG